MTANGPQTPWPELAATLPIAGAAEFEVVCLCAEWCRVCREYRSGFREIARAFPQACFSWLDVEEHADELGDLEVENFPTLLIKRKQRVLFFGTLLPSPAILKRTIEAFLQQSNTESEEYALSSADRRAWQNDADLARTRCGKPGEIVS